MVWSVRAQRGAPSGACLPGSLRLSMGACGAVEHVAVQSDGLGRLDEIVGVAAGNDQELAVRDRWDWCAWPRWAK